MLSKILSVSVISLGLATGAVAQTTAVTPNDQTMTNTDNAGRAGTYGSNNTTSGQTIDPGMTHSTNGQSNSRTTGSEQLTHDSPCAAPSATPTEGAGTSPVNRTQC